MQERDPQNLNFHWCTLFVRSLYEEGITEVVISPGSRSTALTLAFAAHPGFNITTIIDERSAAFTALGIGKASDKPACLVCTSGTAVANYLPAVVEATQSGIPMIIASADRPPELRNTGASQTIDQIKIFGDYPRFFHEVGVPDTSSGSESRLVKLGSQAVSTAVRQRGVSHLNFSFRKPFEPTVEFLSQVEAENKEHTKRSFSTYEQKEGQTEFGTSFWKDLTSAEKPLIILGPCRKNSFIQKTVQDLADLLNAPVLTEPGSNLPASENTITGFDGFLRSAEVTETLSPDLILRFGEEPVSKALQSFIQHHSATPQLRFLRNGEQGDELSTANKTLYLDNSIRIPEVSASAGLEWLQSWKEVQQQFADYRKDQFPTASSLTDGYVFHTLESLMPKDSYTMLSNSFPVRDKSLFCDYDGKEIYVNRGAAGIDGITSTAMGLSISLKKPGFLFTGDIAFLHDSSALLNARYIQQPLFIILLNNGGGTIFRMLPVKGMKEEYFRHFETPQNVSFAELCKAHDVKHQLVTQAEDLSSYLTDNLNKPGVHVLECVTDAEGSMNLRKALWNFSPSLS